MTTHYTGFEYLLIDAANQMGHDKWLFEQRIQWAYDNFDNLENLYTGDKHQPQYLKAVMAIRAAQRGEEIGHLVGLDACCSGMQIMSVLTGCLSGSKATNLINTGVRNDAYTMVTDVASMELGGGLSLKRSAIKTATMTHLYGSRAEPKKLFGEDTPELAAFYAGIQVVCPLANELLGDLIYSWKSYAEVHTWELPDGYIAYVPVTDTIETRVEVDEMDHATFEYAYKVVCGKEHDVKNAANVIHSIDAYVLRCMERLCNYDAPSVLRSMLILQAEKAARDQGAMGFIGEAPTQLQKYIDLFERTNMADVVIFNHMGKNSACFLSDDHIERLLETAEWMLSHKPFEIVTVHDEFKCHPNNCNYMREAYVRIFAEMADSNILNDIFRQLTGGTVSYQGAYHNLSELIKESEYALS